MFELFKLLCERVGKPFTYNKLSHVLDVSPETVRRYVQYFENTYLFYSIERYSKSLNERVYSPKKAYVGDVGIRNITTGFKDKGSIYENLVFLNLLRKSPIYYLYENGVEIDFLFNKSIIECKYKSELKGKQLSLFNRLKFSKSIATDYSFFLNV